MCKKAKCPNFKLNCDFHGTKTECDNHKTECKYNHLKETIIQKELFFDEVLKMNHLLTETNNKLNDLIVSNRTNETNLRERLGKT